MLLSTEIYLDRYFRDPLGLLKALNAQIAVYNTDKPEADLIAAFDEQAEAWPQLNKIAYWSATGSGKTYTAFQIIWRLLKAHVKSRVLFLADRNVLVDDPKIKDFSPFAGKMTKITNRTVDKAFEVYLAIYQAITGNEETQDIFKQFSPEFFDLIIVDECHRGSASADSAWREVLEYFSSATQLGLTATPKETTEVSTSYYFGDPVYTYSLKQGIEDGFLAPYKVIRVDLDKDLTGWRPERGKLDKHGEEIEDRVYNQKDFDRTLVLEKRTEVVAKKLTELLRATGQYSKTIVFCDDIDLAPGETLVSTIDPIVPAEPSDSVGSSQTGNGPWPGDNGTEKTSAS